VIAGNGPDWPGGIPTKVKIINDIRATIQDVRDLPTLPTIAVEVMTIAANRQSSVGDLVSVINVDVGLTGKILRTANSAFYGVPRKIDTLKMALMILGMDEISNLAATASILKLFQKSQLAKGFDISHFWYHSAAVAELTAGLYERLRLPRPSGSYVAGLLHDVGRLIIFQYFNSYHAQIDELISQGYPNFKAEIAVLGVDHGHVGSWVARRWNLPEDMVNAIAQHHVRAADVQMYSEPAIIDRADQLFYLISNKSSEETIAFLRDSEDWQSWLGARGGTIASFVQDMVHRLERASLLLELLK
jgi:putative nucleotidyltransferase with HDIG domain